MINRALTPRLRGERGAVLIQVAFALLGFTMVSALVADYGWQLVARNQAQNAADSAALAAATALAFDGYKADPMRRTRTSDTGVTLANRHAVADGAASVDVDPTVFCSASPDDPLSTKAAQACVQVTVYRDAAHFNAIPAFFGRLMRVDSLDISARAIGQARVGNATNCLRPIAIPDRWTEGTPPWTPASTFNPAAGDEYYFPTISESKSSMTLSSLFGTKVTLHEGKLTTPAAIQPWWYLPVNIPGSVAPADLRQNTAECAKAEVTLNASLDIAGGMLHTNALAIVNGIADLMAKDPAAVWNGETGRVDSSCADALPRCASISPRVIPIALYDPQVLFNDSVAAAPTSVSLTNIIGFFIESVSGTDITGYITTYPGLRDPDVGGWLIDDSSFLRAPMLVQ